MDNVTRLAELHASIVECSLCPRLVEYRERVAREKVARFRDHEYWGKPVPPFGDSKARLLIMGLAPAAHGGNRTGRSFTGDPSGDWLYGALYRNGFANQPASTSLDDGLELNGAYITNAVRCAPPDNKPATAEKLACQPFLVRELELLDQVSVVVALGKFAFDAYLQARIAAGAANPRPLPRFGHGAACELEGGVTLVASYHPSRQNTQTGKLTSEMFDTIFRQAREMLGADVILRGNRHSGKG
ncbi:MAG: uracil-DNA glycosylase [Chloroflexota bacterium]|nr:uracil-DNA glycosylase [Chloroflexota bacterium]